MAREKKLMEVPPVLELDLTIEDLMEDLEPGWNKWSPTSQAAAADVAALLAALR